MRSPYFYILYASMLNMCGFPNGTSMCGACTGYAKPDYANIAHTFGARYAYLDAAFAEPARSHNLIDREAVHVDAADLARASLKLLRRAA